MQTNICIINYACINDYAFFVHLIKNNYMPKREIPAIPEVVKLQVKEIGEKVKQLRSLADDGKNYKEFAEKHGLNNMTLSRIENGKDSRLSVFLNVLRELGISPEDFFKGIK